MTPSLSIPVTAHGRRLSSRWLRNLNWMGRPRSGYLAHGTLLREPGDTPAGKQPFSEVFASIAGQLKQLIPTESGPMAVVSADQVHGDHVAVIRQAGDLKLASSHASSSRAVTDLYEFPDTDALVTDQLGTLLVIQTADCLPVMLWDSQRNIIGAVHAGRAGLEKRLIQKTISCMVERGSSKSAIEVWIGPGIRAENYEVGSNIVKEFKKEFPGVEVSPDGKNLDLFAVAQAQLIEEGLNPYNITDSGLCTYSEAARLHSYRRDGDKSGRIYTMIGLVQPEEHYRPGTLGGISGVHHDIKLKPKKSTYK